MIDLLLGKPKPQTTCTSKKLNGTQRPNGLDYGFHSLTSPI